MAIELRVLGRHQADEHATAFEYNGVTFSQDNLNVFLGLNAVDSRENVEQAFACLREHSQVCARMGAYKPRTSPYSFQGMGKDCLPWMFELAGKYGIRVVSMEVTREAHIDEIREALAASGQPTGVMLQIGTRNTQNFELLKAVGRAREFPILLKRGFGITLDESLMAAEYCASEGNTRIIFGLRGMKTHFGDPHRNLVDFSHVPVVHRMTRMPVCVDPSHSVGNREASPDGIRDIFHVAAQGVIAGANMLLVDVHPAPHKSLVDAAQAMSLGEIPHFLADVSVAREAWERRQALARQFDA
ncbi:MAG TPA: 3-deoxy-7-phosphoheptulonate synthase [Usitatibacteraceae bacterium]|nr:3-deoxy-7-phosphoheptulonate synthase [Usitatibacteraceae bacterium]